MAQDHVFASAWLPRAARLKQLRFDYFSLLLFLLLIDRILQRLLLIFDRDVHIVDSIPRAGSCGARQFLRCSRWL
jgi:hypothetical protein